jgi:(p)ppGpp synthase/HD superfamily hydrolase
MTVWNQDLFIKAWNFACEAHQGQLVPGTDLAYVNHVGLVAMETMAAITHGEAVHSPDLLVLCALLHDTIEDTSVTHDDLNREFGKDVADGVLALSKNKQLLTKDEQMQDSLNRIKQQPHEIWMVKLADRITNLQPPPAYWNDEKIRNYRKEAMLIRDELGTASEYLAMRLTTKIGRYLNYGKTS